MDFSPCDVSQTLGMLAGEVESPHIVVLPLQRWRAVSGPGFHSASIRSLLGQGQACLPWRTPAGGWARTVRMDVSASPKDDFEILSFYPFLVCYSDHFYEKETTSELVLRAMEPRNQFLKNCGKQCDVCLFKHREAGASCLW